MASVVHYKFVTVSDESTPFCKLASDYYPKRNTETRKKLNPLPGGAKFGEGFCSDCDDKLKELKLIKE